MAKHLSFVLSLILTELLITGSVLAEPVEDDIWAIQPSGKQVSATLGKSKKATLRGRLSRPTEAARPKKSTAAEAPVETKATLHWKVPTSAVDNYTIRYGTQPDKLDTEIHIASDSLDTVVDKVHGKVFRYTITTVPESEFLYYSLQADGPLGLSPATPAQKVVVKRQTTQN